VMAEAALLLCHREPRTLTGRIAYSQELLAEFGVPVPRLPPRCGDHQDVQGFDLVPVDPQRVDLQRAQVAVQR
jgi:hypothetical protein